MKVNMNTRKVWFCWFVFRWTIHKEGGGYGVTPAKIRKLESTIMDDTLLWEDVILRHGFAGVFPWDAMENDKPHYDHAMGNFWGMIYPMFR